MGKREAMDELKRLRERVRRLETALVDRNLQLALEREYLEEACKRAGIKHVEEFKKKNKQTAADHAIEQGRKSFGINVSSVCRRLGMSRQNYYARQRRRQRRRVDHDLVVELVRQKRQLQPRLGTRKLHRLLQEPLAEAGVSLGRDRLFEILRDHGLLLSGSGTDRRR